MSCFSLWILQYQLCFTSHGFLLPQKQVFLCSSFCCQLHVQVCEGDLAIKTPSKLVYTTIFIIPKKNDCWLLKANFNTHPFPRKKKKSKSFFCLLGWLVVFFPLKRRPFQNNLLHPAQHGKRKYPVQLHLVGAFRNNFNSHFLLNVSPFICITRGCWAVEAKLWPPMEAPVLFAAFSHHSFLLTAPELCQGLCGTVWALLWASHITSLGTGANWANHFMIPPWKIITSAVSILHLRLVFPCSKRGGCTWVVSKAFPSLPLQKPGAVSAVHGIQGSSVFLEVFEGLPQQNSPSHGWDQEKPQGKKLF